MSSGLLSIIESRAFHVAYTKIPKHISLMSSDELLLNFRPTKVDYALRSAFWNEFRLASLNGDSILLRRVYGGICSYQHFYHNVLNNHLKLAWLIQPYSDYEKEIEPLIMKSVERLNDLLNLPIIDEKNRVDSKAAKVVLDTIKLIDSKTESVKAKVEPPKKKSPRELLLEYSKIHGDDSLVL